MTNSNCPKIQELITSLRALQNEIDGEISSLSGNRQLDEMKINELQRLKEIAWSKLAKLRFESDYKDWKRYKNGEKILSYDGKSREWQPHPKGIVININDHYFLNNNTIVSEDEFNNYFSTLKPRVTQKNFQYFLDGRLVYEGKQEREGEGYLVLPHPQGVIIEKKGQIILNGKTLLYEGDYKVLSTCPRGIIVQKENGFYFYDHWPVDHPEMD